MSTRYLADSLGLPPEWQAERYASGMIRLIGPGSRVENVVLPYNSVDLDWLKKEVAAKIAPKKP